MTLQTSSIIKRLEEANSNNVLHATHPLHVDYTQILSSLNADNEKSVLSRAVLFPVRTGVTVVDGEPGSGKTSHTNIIHCGFHKTVMPSVITDYKSQLITNNLVDTKVGIIRLSSLNATDLEHYARSEVASSKKLRILSDVRADLYVKAKHDAAQDLTNRTMITGNQINRHMTGAKNFFGYLIKLMQLDKDLLLILGKKNANVHIYTEGSDEPFKAAFGLFFTILPVNNTWLMEIKFNLKKCELLGVDASSVQSLITVINARLNILCGISLISEQEGVMLTASTTINFTRKWLILCLFGNTNLVLSAFIPGVELTPDTMSESNVGTLSGGFPGDILFTYSSIRTIAVLMGSTITIENLDLYKDAGTRMKGVNANYLYLANNNDQRSSINVISGIDLIRFRDGKLHKPLTFFIENCYIIVTAIRHNLTSNYSKEMSALIDTITEAVSRYYTTNNDDLTNDLLLEAYIFASDIFTLVSTVMADKNLIFNEFLMIKVEHDLRVNKLLESLANETDN